MSLGRNVLVETGTGVNDVILDKMRSLGVLPSHVDIILLTHMHGDHIGSLQKNGRPVFPNAKVYVNARDRDYFTTGSTRNQAAVAALAAYGSNVVTFDPNPLSPVYREFLPGIRPIAAYGHTPGHTAYLVDNGTFMILIAGDFVHVAAVQFPNPYISATYDVDQRAAAESRWLLMDYAARNRIPIGGMHIEFPGIGMVETDGNGFRFVPIR
jgi:glyoxylase-like metal-dependent hydrolase (beta-lactamase superfamily II)